MSYIEKETLVKEVASLEQLARKRVYDTPTNSPAYERYSTQYQERNSILSIIKAQTTADVVEVRHGEWNDNIIGFCNVCMECGVIVERAAIKNNSGKLNYCPNCGAKMDGERIENGT